MRQNCHLNDCAWLDSGNRVINLFYMLPNLRPPRREENYDANVPVHHILLVPKALISGHENVVPFSLGEVEQLAIVIFRPTLLRQRIH